MKLSISTRLKIIAFTTGFALMAYELVAARILAPTIGSSTYVWTSVIGVIIAALSIGYWLGGVIADKRKMPVDIAILCIVSAGGVLVTLLGCNDVLDAIPGILSDPRIQALVASLILFAPASLALGMLSPYLVKIEVTSLEHAGRSVASLSALNSIGGITGTFVTGFIIFSYIGSQQALFIVIALLLVSGWLITPRIMTVERAIATVIIIFTALIVSGAVHSQAISIDTASARYEIVNGVNANGREIRVLNTGPRGSQSGIFTDGSPDLAFWYTNELARLTIDQQPKNVLILGGGAFTLPQFLANQLPDTQIDVVEIDPKLAGIASKYFNYQPSDSITTITTDARAFLDQNTKQYDLIIVDVYGDTSVPFQLMTKEYGQHIARSLTPDGIVLANVIAAREGACKPLLNAVNGSYKSELSFAQYSSQVIEPTTRTNYIIAYTAQREVLPFMMPLDMSDARAYSDDYMPAERLQHACLDS